MPRWTAVASIPVVSAFVGVLISAGAVSAQPNNCSAGKLSCISTFNDKALGCFKTNVKNGNSAQNSIKLGDCLDKATDKFAGCLIKIEAKQKIDKPATLCPTEGDGEMLFRFVQSFITDDVLDGVAPSGPSVSKRTCVAGKIVCVAGKSKSLLKCHAQALKKGVLVDAVCVLKARAKFDGGSNPVKACFAKLEAKQNPAKPPTLCETQNDVAPLEGAVDNFVDAAVVRVAPP